MLREDPSLFYAYLFLCLSRQYCVCRRRYGECSGCVAILGRIKKTYQLIVLKVHNMGLRG